MNQEIVPHGLQKINPIEMFKNDMFEVRTVLIGDEPWFVAIDVAKALGYSDTATMTRRLDYDEKGMQILQTLGGMQSLAIINESGLYSAILGSNKPEAKPFKKWVTNDVLPAIRKHGAYLTDSKIEEVLTDPDTIIRLATELKAERAEKAELKMQIEADKPKVAFANAVQGEGVKSSLRNWINSLKSSKGLNVGERDVISFLIEKDFLYRDTKKKLRSYSHYYETPSNKRGYFSLDPFINTHSDGAKELHQLHITGVGQVVLGDMVINHFNKQATSA